MKSILFIDGQNFIGKARLVFKTLRKTEFKWDLYDFAGLLNKILQGEHIDEKIFYFARLREHPETIEKSKQLVEERRLLKTSLEKQGFIEAYFMLTHACQFAINNMNNLKQIL